MMGFCMRPVRRFSLFLALAVALAAAAPARATLILALDLAALVGRAERIAVVDVVSVQSFWNARHDRIMTAVQLSVVDGWKGDLPAGARLTVLQPGGTVGDLTTTADGMPRFAVGERTVVFLHGPPDRATVVGLTQGNRPLRRDPTSGRWLVRGVERAGAEFVRPRAAAGLNAAPAAPVLDARERPLEELRAQVQALAASR
jgi:hypothetical protein